MIKPTPPPEIESICVASRGRRTAEDGAIEQHLEVCPEPGKTNCLTTVAKDNLILQRPRGDNPGTLYADKAPTLSQSAWEQNNLLIESACLTPRRTEYGKAIRRQYDAGEVKCRRKEITRLEPRTDGKTNTITTVQKDNLILQVNTSAESNGRQPYQQNRVYDPEGIAPALMEGVGGRTVKVLIDGQPQRIRRLTPGECAKLQTIPAWYKFVVSETQQYRMLGNGWTVEVIKHIFSFLPDKFKEQ